MSAERDSIVAYLRMIARCEVGTILTAESREIVGWCASWIENRLDERDQPMSNDYDTEAMAIALHEHLVYREGGTPNWAALSPERKAALVSEAGMLIQRYMTRSEERAALSGPRP